MTKTPNKLNAKVKPTKAVRKTKKSQLVKMLNTKAGADIKTLSDQLGWQQHTTRAAVSGLRKAGYEVANEKPAKGGSSRYRILSTPTSDTVSAEVAAPNGA